MFRLTLDSQFYACSIIFVTHMGTCGRASRIWPSRIGRRGLLAPRNCDWQPRAARRGG